MEERKSGWESTNIGSMALYKGFGAVRKTRGKEEKGGKKGRRKKKAVKQKRKSGKANKADTTTTTEFRIKRRGGGLLWDSGLEVGECADERGSKRACSRVLCPAACSEGLECSVADKERGSCPLGKAGPPCCFGNKKTKKSESEHQDMKT